MPVGEGQPGGRLWALKRSIVWNPIRFCLCLGLLLLSIHGLANDLWMAHFAQHDQWLKLARQARCSLEMRSPRSSFPGSWLEWSLVPEGHNFCIFAHSDSRDAASLADDVANFLNESIGTLAEGQSRIHILDIGGGPGWSTLFALATDERVRVTVFEPLSHNREMLNVSLFLNGWQERVNIIERAACDRERHEQSFCYRPGNESAPWGAIKVKANDCADDNGTMVIGASIDKLMGNSPFGRVHIMKVAADGLEPYLFNGAKEFLWQHQPVFVLVSWVGFQIKASGWQRDPTEMFDIFFPSEHWSYALAGDDFVQSYRQVKAKMGCWQHTNCPFRSGGNILLRDRSWERRKRGSPIYMPDS